VLTVVEEQDHVAVEDGRDPVRDRDDRRLGELLPERLLDQVVRCGVHRGGGFVQDEDFAPFQDYPTKAHKLTLTHAPVLAVLYHCKESSEYYPEHVSFLHFWKNGTRGKGIMHGRNEQVESDLASQASAPSS
jgi:hypothetical protein